MLGNILIIVAQVIVAAQMVVEEKLLGAYDLPPLMVVGFEGLFGFTFISILLVVMCVGRRPLHRRGGSAERRRPSSSTPHACRVTLPALLVGHRYFVPAPSFLCTSGDCSRFEDAVDAFVQMGNSPALTLWLLGNVFSIAFFNYFGVSVTRAMSASTRMVLDSVRTILIWAVSLLVKWEDFCWVQLLGFAVRGAPVHSVFTASWAYRSNITLRRGATRPPSSPPRPQVLIAGQLIYNQIVRLPCFTYDPEEGAAGAGEEDKDVALLMAEGAGGPEVDDDFLQDEFDVRVPTVGSGRKGGR
jgi:hypothetical protein